MLLSSCPAPGADFVRKKPIGVFIRGDGYGGAVKGEEGASNPTQTRRLACESAGGATHEPHKTHPTLLDLALSPLTETLRP